MPTSYGTLPQIQLPDTANSAVSYIRKRLGEPYIQVNVSDEQIYDRIADAFQYFRDYCEDGTEHVFVAHELTLEDIYNRYIPVGDDIFEIIRVLQPFQIDKNILTDITYNIRHSLNFSDFMMSVYSGDILAQYDLTMTKIQELIDRFQPIKSIRYNRYGGKLYWNEDFERTYDDGTYMVFEAYAIIDPEVYGKIFSDRRFLALATAYVKKQWGEILQKFDVIPLFGGMKLNADKIYAQADREIEKAEQDIKDNSEGVKIFMG